jgi:hypothetical protein
MLVTCQVLIRMVIATSAHPRIALITATLSVAISDMCHFFFIFGLVFYGFAVIASWRFGGAREDLKSVTSTLYTQFDSMLGAPGYFGLSQAQTENWEYTVYCFLFHTVTFFFMLNFVLAIIVDSYGTVMATINESVVAQDMVSDLVAAIRTKYMSMRYGWPKRKNMLKHIETVGATFLNPPELEELGFRNDEAMNAFFKFYSRFEALLIVPKDEHTLDEVNFGLAMSSHKMDHLNMQQQECTTAAARTTFALDARLKEMEDRVVSRILQGDMTEQPRSPPPSITGGCQIAGSADQRISGLRIAGSADDRMPEVVFSKFCPPDAGSAYFSMTPPIIPCESI